MKDTTPQTPGAILYTRVSTGEQDKHGTSPESQLDACRAKALALGLPIVAEYYDAGISGGFLTSRAGMQAALADIQAGRADTLICANMSRYSRDVEHQQQIRKAIQQAAGRLVFCDMTFDDTPGGDLMFTVAGGFQQYEKMEIRKRLTGGLHRRAGEGRQPGRVTPPYGYHIVNHRDVIRETYPPEEVGRYIVREDQAATVRRIFAAYHAGTHSLIGLGRELTAEGVPTPGRSSQWCMTTIRYILMNPVYKGVAVYGRSDNSTDEARLAERHWRTGETLKEPRYRTPADPSTWITMPCPALVSEEVWDAVQGRFADNKAKRGGNPQRVKMLAARIFCPHCGRGLNCTGGRRNRAGVTGNKPPYYTCSGYVNSLRRDARPDGVPRPACLSTIYPVADVERAVVVALLDACARPEAVAAALAVYARPAPVEAADPRKEIAALDRALQELGADEAAAVRGQIEGIRSGASPSAYAAVFADIAAQRKDMEDRRGALGRQIKKVGRGPQAAPDAAALTRQALTDAARVLTSPDVPEAAKRDNVGLLIEKVVPRREGPHVTAAIHFLPGVLPGSGGASETVQPSSEGSESTRALLSLMRAVRLAAKEESRFRPPPPKTLL